LQSDKHHHRARAQRRQVDRLDTVVRGMSIIQRELEQRAKPEISEKLILELDLQDGFVDTLRVTKDTRIHKIPRQAAA
jgi:hypothetical protein